MILFLKMQHWKYTQETIRSRAQTLPQSSPLKKKELLPHLVPLAWFQHGLRKEGSTYRKQMFIISFVEAMKVMAL